MGNFSQHLLYVIGGILGFILLQFIIYVIYVKVTKQSICCCHFRPRRPNRVIQPTTTTSSKLLPKVLTESQFDMLPRQILQEPLVISESMKEDELDSCSICLSKIRYGDELVTLFPCGHQYHTDCIKQWLTTRSMLCPLCKADIKAGLGIDNDDVVEQHSFVSIPEPARTR